MIRAFLYDAEGHDEELSTAPPPVSDLGEHQILWVEVTAPDRADLARLKALFPLRPQLVRNLASPERRFSLDNYGDHFHCDVAALLAPRSQGSALPRTAPSTRLDFVVAAQWLITVQAESAPFLAAFREQDKGETEIGALTGPQLAASLLDWHLEAFLRALEDLEHHIDGLDVHMLSRRRAGDDLLGELILARRYVAGLRRLLSPQRAIFYGASRPDFTPVIGEEARPHFASLERRFERTLDAVDHGRELMQSSFDLFSTRTAETTNVLLRRLTFLSVMLGAIAAVACLLSMDVPQPLAGTPQAFWVILGVLAATALAGAAVGRWRRWI